ncbi:MAG: hypothetical protein IGS54_29150 [Elainella sp. C42_A2020_010]|nr:hypothetical protein [Elainella sp. C42_A2020_010]RNJ70853.1 MAG: hypothetical protein EDM05_02455 [Leptolyngbya sp. IPPAS B-1204]
MPQQLQLFVESTVDSTSEASPQPPVLNLSSISLATDSWDDTGSDSLLEQTRQLFQHNGSNTELMAQVMAAIRALDEIFERPCEHQFE